MNWSVYILRCSDNSLYTGVAKDIERRLKEHNSDNNRGAKYTRSRRPVTLVYQEQLTNRSSALKREQQLKALTRLSKLQLIDRYQNANH